VSIRDWLSRLDDSDLQRADEARGQLAENTTALDGLAAARDADDLS